MDERRVDRHAERPEERRPAAAEAPSQEEDDEDRPDAHEGLEDADRPFARATGDDEEPGVEPGSARGPVARGFRMEFRAAVAAFGVERLGEGVVGVRVVGGALHGVLDRDRAEDEPEGGDQRQRDQRSEPITGGQRAEPVADGVQGRRSGYSRGGRKPRRPAETTSNPRERNPMKRISLILAGAVACLVAAVGTAGAMPTEGIV